MLALLWMSSIIWVGSICYIWWTMFAPSSIKRSRRDRVEGCRAAVLFMLMAIVVYVVATAVLLVRSMT